LLTKLITENYANCFECLVSKPQRHSPSSTDDVTHRHQLMTSHTVINTVRHGVLISQANLGV